MEMSPKKYMMMAYEEMLKTNADVEKKKESPLVGAVLVLNENGKETIIKAHRCQTRDGHHAEETLIDDLNQEREFNGTETLFVTLEPCIPESRSSNKIACAQRIVDARIKNVYIGMLDPNPSIFHKGVDFLIEHHVSVTLFDEEITAKIKEANKLFIASFGEESPEIYRTLELNVGSKLSSEAIDFYCKQAHIDISKGRGLFWDRMISYNLISKKNKTIDADPLLYICFGKDPYQICDGAEVVLKVLLSPNSPRNPTGRRFEYSDSFKGPFLLAIEQVKEWVDLYVPKTQNRDGLKTEIDYLIPWLSIKEAFVNSIVHRSFSGRLSGAFTFVTITENSISFTNPCELSDSEKEKIEAYSMNSVPVNPRLARLFKDTELMERSGFGMMTFRTGTVTPIISYDGQILSVTFSFSLENDLDMLNQRIKKSGIVILKDDYYLFKFIKNKGEVTREEVGKEFGLPSRTANYRLKKLIDCGLVKRVGEAKSRLCKYIAI